MDYNNRAAYTEQVVRFIYVEGVLRLCTFMFTTFSYIVYLINCPFTCFIYQIYKR